MITRVKGYLEIDHTRGVIYFHGEHHVIGRMFGTATPLRICRLPAPIPSENLFIDITHMIGVSYKAT